MKQVLFFSSTEEFRAWLERNHANETELFVGFYKKASAKPSITWPESVDAALCYGWIDGVRNAIDMERGQRKTRCPTVKASPDAARRDQGIRSAQRRQTPQLP